MERPFSESGQAVAARGEDETVAANSIDDIVTHLESAIAIVEEGIQLLQETVHRGEVQLL